MAVLQGRTLNQLTTIVGHLLGAIYASAASAQGSTTTIKDNTLPLGGTDDQKGKRVRFVSGTSGNIGLVSQVTGSVVAASVTTLTFAPARTQTESADGYELWDEWCHPARVQQFINQAIIEATPLTFDPVESLAFHGDGNTARFDIPSGLSFLKEIAYRQSVSSVVIHNCEAVWDELVDADVTASLDDEDKMQGSNSQKLVVAAAVAAADILATDSMTSLDISGYDYVEFWAKCTVATAAGDLQLLLDNTASCASPLETLSLPALTADTWTYCRVALANPELDTALISVGLKYTVDIGACTIWLDGIKAVKNSSASWVALNRRLWKIDQEARDLVLNAGVPAHIGYALLKLSGGDKLALLTAETTVTELDEGYITAFATGHMLLASSGGPSTDPDTRRQAAQLWLGKAEAAKRSFPAWVNIRPVD